MEYIYFINKKNNVTLEKNELEMCINSALCASIPFNWVKIWIHDYIY